VTAGEKGLEDEDESPRERGDFEPDRPPVLTLLRRDGGRVRFLVCKNLQDADEVIAEYGEGSVILCTDGYGIYDGVRRGGRPLAVTHSNRFVIGDAHPNHCVGIFFFDTVAFERLLKYPNSALIIFLTESTIPTFIVLGPDLS